MLGEMMRSARACWRDLLYFGRGSSEHLRALLYSETHFFTLVTGGKLFCRRKKILIQKTFIGKLLTSIGCKWNNRRLETLLQPLFPPCLKVTQRIWTLLPSLCPSNSILSRRLSVTETALLLTYIKSHAYRVGPIMVCGLLLHVKSCLWWKLSQLRLLSIPIWN